MLRIEGRLAAKLGDRESAIRAWRQYLELRSDPAPALRGQADSVRTALARISEQQASPTLAHDGRAPER